MSEAVKVTKPSHVLAIVCAGICLANLDLFIVNVALPNIAHDFGGAGLDDLSWILNGYAIVYAALLVFFGRLAERHHRDLSFLLGIAIFTAAATLAPMAGELQPHSLALTSAKVSAPTPRVTRAAPQASGRGTSCPGTRGSMRQPTTRAARPIGTLTMKIQRQLAVNSRPPTTGPRAAARPPIAVQVRTAPARRSGA